MKTIGKLFGGGILASGALLAGGICAGFAAGALCAMAVMDGLSRDEAEDFDDGDGTCAGGCCRVRITPRPAAEDDDSYLFEEDASGSLDGQDVAEVMEAVAEEAAEAAYEAGLELEDAEFDERDEAACAAAAAEPDEDGED